MKKLFMRAGALLMAAFVLMGAIMVAAPVQVSAASVLSGTWIFNEILLPPVGSTQIGSGSSFSVTFSDGSVVDYNNLYVYGQGEGSNTSGKKVLTFGLYENDRWVRLDDVYIFDSNTWLQPVDCITFNTDITNESLITWFGDNANFIQPPPATLEEVMTDLKEQNLLTQVLAGVIQMIPIGLACWVGYKGLRKALDLLLRILHQA